MNNVITLSEMPPLPTRLRQGSTTDLFVSGAIVGGQAPAFVPDDILQPQSKACVLNMN
jgi:hypothetical protein